MWRDTFLVVVVVVRDRAGITVDLTSTAADMVRSRNNRALLVAAVHTHTAERACLPSLPLSLSLSY